MVLGYRPGNQGIFNTADPSRYGALIKTLQNWLDRFDREDGTSDTVGRLLVRLARVMKLD
jgi:hypothetical protein